MLVFQGRVLPSFIGTLGVICKNLNHLLEMPSSLLWLQSLQWLVKMCQTTTSYINLGMKHSTMQIPLASAFQISSCSSWLPQMRLSISTGGSNPFQLQGLSLAAHRKSALEICLRPKPLGVHGWHGTCQVP